MKQIAKRVVLFLAVNFLVILAISIILNIFNIKPYLTSHGIDYKALLIFCLIWGMAGAFISLALSRQMAKWFMGVHLINSEDATPKERELIDIIHKLARRAGLPKMPEVGIYDSFEVNAFATGPSRARSLVAVSTGLLKRMNGAEIEGVLGHEIAHIMNGDMVTMTLLQGIVNAFVMFFARIVAWVVAKSFRKDSDAGEPSPFPYMFLVFAFEILFMILGTIVIATYSRFREFRADSGGARLAGREKMIGALHALERAVNLQDPHAEQPAFQAFKISNTKGMLRWFSTHPPLEERIKRLEEQG
ncbi:MAG TPA: protease HtpX [Chlamydiales bacterium]|nr:protease HtpX [Chlamydiales bacterium]